MADHDDTSHFLNDSVSNLLPWKLSLQSKVDEMKGAGRKVPDKTKYRSPIQRVNRDKGPKELEIGCEGAEITAPIFFFF